MKRLRCLVLAAPILGCQVRRVPPPDTLAGSLDVAVDATPACGITRQTVITGAGIGQLRIGESLRDVITACRALRDTTVVRGGRPVRLVTIDLLRDTVVAQIARDTVERIEVSDSSFHTADNLGVQTRVSKLVTLRDARGVTDDSALYAVLPDHCGLRFRLIAPAPAPPAPQLGIRALRRLPGETRVDRVLIVGCNDVR